MNLLYRLEASGQSGDSRRPEGPGGVLGKLDIRWRAALGEVGRLQTQPIVASAAVAKDFELQVSHVEPCSVPDPFYRSTGGEVIRSLRAGLGRPSLRAS